MDFVNINNKNEPVVIRDSETRGGEPVFRGTRVPLKSLFDYLAAGETIDRFVSDFPSISRQKIIETLNQCQEVFLQKTKVEVIPEEYIYAE